MKALVSILLLLAFFPTMIYPRPIPMTLENGTSGFFLERSDMEECVVSLEKQALLEEENLGLKRALSSVTVERNSFKVLSIILGSTTVVGLLVGFAAGVLVK